MKLIFFIFWVGLLGVTLVSLTELRHIAFTNESALYLSEINDINYFFSFIFLAIMLVLIFSNKIRRYVKMLGFSLALILWLVSGRTVCEKLWPEDEARLSCGYYIFKINEYSLCDRSIDYCETVILKETSISNLPFWKVSIENEYIDQIIFVGPFTWKSSKAVLNSH